MPIDSPGTGPGLSRFHVLEISRKSLFRPGNPHSQNRCMGARVYMLPGVNLFASGVYRGQRWTPDDVRQMARNAQALGPKGMGLLLPSASPGHEDDNGWQEFVGRTDEPAVGWVNPASVKAVTDPRNPGELLLKGDIVNVLPAMVEELDKGTYRFGSSEIYEDFQDDFGKSHGKTLRKFSFLGSQVPQVKRLGPLPKAVLMPEPMHFAERTDGKRVILRQRRVGVATFADAATLDKPQMIQAVTAIMPGMSRAALEGLPDETLAELVTNLPAPPQPATAPPTEFAQMSREELIAALTEAGQDPTALAAMDDAALQSMYDEMMGGGGMGGEVTEMAATDPAMMTREELIAALIAQGQDPATLEAMSDDDLRAMLTTAAATPAEAPVMMGEKKKKKAAITTYAEKQIRRIAELNRHLAREAQKIKTRDVTAFCESLKKNGQITPGLEKFVRSYLLALDNTQPIHNFSENGVTRKVSALEAVKGEMAKLPKLVAFGDRLPGEQPGKEDPDREIRAVTTFAARVFQKDADRAQYVAKFSELKAKDPTLTARKYGVDPQYC